MSAGPEAGRTPGPATSPSPSVWSAGLRCRCPACGRGKLFSGFLTVVERCESCGSDLRAHDTGDGPAVFIILILGFVVVGAALIVEVRYEPPLWVHALLWPPLIVIGALGLLRPFKGVMVALAFRHRRDTFAA
ncbi:MAG: DUF983 domain-containing protein [Gemmatimonas sp.]